MKAFKVTGQIPQPKCDITDGKHVWPSKLQLGTPELDLGRREQRANPISGFSSRSEFKQHLAEFLEISGNFTAKSYIHGHHQFLGNEGEREGAFCLTQTAAL